MNRFSHYYSDHAEKLKIQNLDSLYEYYDSTLLRKILINEINVPEIDRYLHHNNAYYSLRKSRPFALPNLNMQFRYRSPMYRMIDHANTHALLEVDYILRMHNGFLNQLKNVTTRF